MSLKPCLNLCRRWLKANFILVNIFIPNGSLFQKIYFSLYFSVGLTKPGTCFHFFKLNLYDLCKFESITWTAVCKFVKFNAINKISWIENTSSNTKIQWYQQLNNFFSIYYIVVVRYHHVSLTWFQICF